MKIWKAALLACLLVCVEARASELLFSKTGEDKYINIQSLKQGQHLILFWRDDCAPCLVELGFLPDISKEFPKLKITLVSLQGKEPVQNHLPKNLPSNIEKVTAVSGAKQVLQAFGNEKLVLPYSVALRRDGIICDKNYGILSKSKIKKWIKICSISKE